MPFYDINRAETSNATGGNESTHFAGKSGATAETATITGFFAAARMNSAGGGIFRAKTNTAGGTVFSGGTAITPTPKNPRQPAAQTTWVSDASAITAGTTLVQRVSAGFAQTGGMGGHVPVVLPAGLQLLSGATPNPVDIEFTSITNGNATLFDATIEFIEGMGQA